MCEITNGIKNAIVNIKIIGVGGGGNNVVKRIAENTDLDLDLIAVNTDHKQLKSLTSDNITTGGGRAFSPARLSPRGTNG